MDTEIPDSLHDLPATESVAAVRLAQTRPTTAAGLPLFFRSLLLATKDAKRGTLPNIAHATADDFVMSGAWADDRDRLAWATALNRAGSAGGSHS